MSTSEQRGRVVMMVDNGVRNDSRVRKSAQSMAERGWNVVLIGRAPGGKAERFRLGKAKVRLVPVSDALSRRPDSFAPAGASLGYLNPRAARYRRQSVRAQQTDARVRRALAAQDTSAVAPLRRAAARARLGRLRLTERWVSTRAEATSKTPVRKQAALPAEQWPTPWWMPAVTRLRGDRSWRVLDPHLWDYELAFGPLIDTLEPDIIHAHDFNMVGVGANAAARARAAGRTVQFIYDAHEYVPGISRMGVHAGWLPARVAYEREYIGQADAVVTVSDTLADMLVEEHGLPEKPTVVLNAPPVGEPAPAEGVPSMRALAGVDATTPLLLYSGGVAPQRGVAVMVEALPRLPEAHVVFVVANDTAPYVQELMGRATELGVRDRIHLLPYVAPEQVVPYVSEADIGVHPTLHHLNHEISLASKFFEYSQARLPIVVSDVKTMAGMVRRTGQGEVFVAGDVDDYVRAITAVLADPQRYRAAYDAPGLLEEWTWEGQADVLDRLYARLTGR
ncbi:MAG: glycosyltransferase family 4 protein [Marmoricola sp.]